MQQDLIENFSESLKDLLEESQKASTLVLVKAFIQQSERQGIKLSSLLRALEEVVYKKGGKWTSICVHLERAYLEAEKVEEKELNDG